MASKLAFSLTQLEYILAVHKHGHFAKAAKACHVTQPTLSMQIQKLEDVLGATIFDRSKKPILLTEIGERLIEQIHAVVFEAKKIKTMVDARKNIKASGELHLGVIPTIAPHLLPRLLPLVKRDLPGLQLVIAELQTQQIIDALDSDELDVGLLATPLNEPQVIERPLYYEPFFVLAHKDHPLGRLKKVRYSGLKYEDIWLLKEGHCLRHQILDICSLKRSGGAKSNFQFESGSLETLKSLVDSSGGYTLLPQLAAKNIGRHSRLLEFDRPIPAREVGLVYRRKQYKVDLIEALGEVILSALPEGVRQIRKGDLDVLPVD